MADEIVINEDDSEAVPAVITPVTVVTESEGSTDALVDIAGRLGALEEWKHTVDEKLSETEFKADMAQISADSANETASVAIEEAVIAEVIAEEAVSEESHEEPAEEEAPHNDHPWFSTNPFRR